MTNRTVQKNLAGQEDLLFGEEVVQQTRGTGNYPVSGIRGFYPCNTLDERNALDTDKHPKAVVVVNDIATFYHYHDATWNEVKVEGVSVDADEVKVDDTLSSGATDAQTALEALDTEQLLQDGRLDTLDTEQAVQDGRLDSVESLQDVSNPLMRVLTKNSLHDTVVGGLTVVNASTKNIVDRYGVVQSIPANTLGETAFGHVVEGASTNLIKWSEDFFGAWGLLGTASVTDNTDIAPNGALSADTLNFPAINDTILQNSGAAAANTYYTASLWLKGVAGETITIEVTNGIDSFLGVQMVLTTGWKRVEVTHLFGATVATARLNITRAASDTATSLQAWGAQLEALPLASSYIKTTASAVTRAADKVTAPVYGNSPQLDDSFSVVLKIKGITKAMTEGLHYFLAIPVNEVLSPSEGFVIIKQAAGNILIRYSDAPSNRANLTVLLPSTDEATLICTSDGITIKAYVNGVQVTSASLSGISATADLTGVIGVGGRPLDALQAANCELSDFHIYDFALNAATIKQLSN